MKSNEFLAKVFTNKKTGQKTIMIPKKKLFGTLPKELKVKIKW